MPREHRTPGQRPIDRYHGTAIAAACDDCAHLIGNPEPSENGIRMRIMHSSHIPELEGHGWVTTHYRHQPPDVTCLHYHLQHWEGEHDGCCGMGGG